MVLSDKNIFSEGLDILIMLEFLAAVVGFSRIREDFYDEDGIQEGVEMLVFKQFFAAGDDNVGINVFVALFDPNTQIAGINIAISPETLVAEYANRVCHNQVVCAARPAHCKDFAVEILAL